MSEEDQWVRVAMDDDNLVVDLLLKLNQTGPYPPPPPPPPAQRKLDALRLDWTVRQRRSTSNSKQQLQPTTTSQRSYKKEAEPAGARASPTTPLSWSGGCGAATSSAADGFEESSRLLVVRSKVAIACETPTTKRSRKKKTLAELKGEESTLLLERRSLNDELAALRLVLEKERAKNENLKRRKLDLVGQTREAAKVSVKSEETNSDQLRQVQDESGPACSVSPKSNTCSKFEQSLPDTSSEMENGRGIDYSFALPDLNLPVNNNSGTDVLYGTS